MFEVPNGYLRSGSRLSSLALQASNSLLSPLRSHLGCIAVSTEMRDEVVGEPYLFCFDEFAGDKRNSLELAESKLVCGKSPSALVPETDVTEAEVAVDALSFCPHEIVLISLPTAVESKDCTAKTFSYTPDLIPSHSIASARRHIPTTA